MTANSQANKNAKASDNQEDKMYMELRKGRVNPADEAGSSLWLITFTDIMALMLTFFVLLYSTAGFTKQFSPTFAERWNRGKQETINIEKVDFTNALPLTYLVKVISNNIDNDENLQNIVLIPQKDHLIVSVPTELLFESGQAEVSDQGKQALFTLGNTMTRIRNRIEIIGHTDPRPIRESGGEFASNWELSLARAGSVAAILRNAGYERDMIVRGLASARYEDLPKDMDEEERLSFARRVDIVVMQDDGSRRNLLDIEQP